MGTHLKVKVTAAPVEGAANEACRDFFSRIFGIAKRNISIVSGARSRQKRILVAGVARESVKAQIAGMLQQK